MSLSQPTATHEMLTDIMGGMRCHAGVEWVVVVGVQAAPGVQCEETLTPAQGGVSLDGAVLQRDQSGLGVTHATAFWWRKSWKVLGFRGKGNRHSWFRVPDVGGLLSHRWNRMHLSQGVPSGHSPTFRAVFSASWTTVGQAGLAFQPIPFPRCRVLS